ncbi:hypothetical protein [Streptomyces sp. NPDC001480]|uniref:hypothetical protein n=1 Tax=Streptomyces sp. NPDC001480 TaxID=3364577 RepID=UPI0036BCD5FD
MLLLILVGLVLVVASGHVVHRRPALAVPLTVAWTAAGVLAAVVFGIVQAGGR